MTRRRDGIRRVGRRLEEWSERVSWLAGRVSRSGYRAGCQGWRQPDSWAEFEGRGQVRQEARNRRATEEQQRSSTRTAQEL